MLARKRLRPPCRFSHCAWGPTPTRFGISRNWAPTLWRRSCPLEDGRGTHAASDAHAHEAVPAAPALHLVEERRRQLRAGAAERVAERNRAAVHVEAVGIDGQLAEARDHLRREGLVELDEIDLVEREPGEL